MRSDWRHRDVLELLARDSGGRPATVSVVTNFEFSVSNFRYYALRDGLGLRWARVWDDMPLGIDYMITKTGDQGPSWTAEKRRRIAEKLATDPHLAAAFPHRRLPAPGRLGRHGPRAARCAASGLAGRDRGSRRRGGAPRDPRVRSRCRWPGIQLDWDGDITRGRIRRLVVTASAATVGELTRQERADDARARRPGRRARPRRHPASAVASGRLDVLDIGGIPIEQATITAGDLSAFLAEYRRFSHARLRLEDSAASFAVEQPGPDVTARVRILPAPDRPFAVQADQVRIGGIAVPSAGTG